MGLSEALLPEFDQEIVSMRKTLERIPDDKFTWKPHDKSMAMGDLATHLANLLGWAVLTANTDSFDLAPVDGSGFRPPQAHTQKELLDLFDKNHAAAREQIASISDESWRQPWTLRQGGQEIFTLPKIAVYRSFIMNHIIHHRAQLGLYLRLNDIAVPSVYGPSADENPGS